MKLEQLYETIERKAGDVIIKGSRIGDFEKWEDNLILENKQLTSLEGCSKEVTGDFSCCGNILTSLEYCPKIVDGDFTCSYNQLTSLKWSPEKIKMSFYAHDNQLTSLEGCPKEIGEELDCSNNQIKDLHDIHKHITKCAHLSLKGNQIESHVLGLLKIENLKFVSLDNDELQDIINKYLPLGDIFECQEELMAAEFEEYAQL
jgi:Leucine-rich repeat (LRR) protein